MENMHDSPQERRCPSCGREVAEDVLYQCCRCFTIYCKSCEDSDAGRHCPKCKMGARLIK